MAVKQICFRADDRSQDNIRYIKYALKNSPVPVNTSDAVRIALEVTRQKYIDDAKKNDIANISGESPA